MNASGDTEPILISMPLDAALNEDRPELLRGMNSVAGQASRRMIVALGGVLFLLMLPVTMMVPVLKELVSDRFGVSSAWPHLFMSINMVAAVLTAPFGGHLADRVGRRKPVLIAALAAHTGVLLLMAGADSLWGLLALRFVEGAVHILGVSTVMALAGDWADPARRGRMMGVVGSSLMLGTAFGAPLGGWIGGGTPAHVFLMGAFVAGLAALIAGLFLLDAPHRAGSSSLKAALRLVLTHRELLVPYAYAFADRLCVGVFVSSFVLYLSNVLEISTSQRGLLIALFMLPFAFLCYPMGRLTDRIGRVVPICAGNIGFGIVFAWYGAIPASWMPSAMIVSGVLSAVMFAPNLALCSDLAPLHQRATVYAGFNVAGSLGFMCGPMLGGAVLALVTPAAGAVAGYQSACAAAGMATVVCALVTLPSLLRLRRLGRTG